MSSNLYKARWVVIGENARVIDADKLMEQRLQKAAARTACEEPWKEEGQEDFASEQAAEKADALLYPDSEELVLKSASVRDKEALEQELEAARKELEGIKEETDRMLQEAGSQIEEMRTKAFEEARTEGYQAGYSEGMAKAEIVKEQYLNKQLQLKEEYDCQIEALEPEFIEVLTEIYEHIFKVDLSSYHQLVVNLLTDAMQKTESPRNYIVHVSRDDYQAVSGAREEILEKTGTLPDHLEIISDMTLSPSQCMIETEDGIYDCSLGTELEELKRKLKLISFKKS